MNMSKIKPNILYKIIGYNLYNYRRYFELGFMVGSVVSLVRFSILKKSMIVKVDGITYSMRTKNANDILIKEV